MQTNAETIHEHERREEAKAVALRLNVDVRRCYANELIVTGRQTPRFGRIQERPKRRNIWRIHEWRQALAAMF